MNLTDVSFANSTIDTTDFSGATLKNTNFSNTAITSAQLYYTASYIAKDLTGIILDDNYLRNWNFENQNLTEASFVGANIGRAKFTDAIISNANFSGATNNGFIDSQLYSTSSYKTKDIHGINLSKNNLSMWNFAGQNLTDADLSK